MSNFRAARILSPPDMPPISIGGITCRDSEPEDRQPRPARYLPRTSASVFAQEARCRRIMFDPDHRNIGARRLCSTPMHLPR